MEKNMFEMAARMKFRFNYKGVITVEDLWDLKKSALNDIYKSLKAEQKKDAEESLMSTKSVNDIVLDTKIDIVKYIFNQKVEEENAAAVSMQKKQQRKKILAIIAEKKDAKLHEMSIEELEAMVEE